MAADFHLHPTAGSGQAIRVQICGAFAVILIFRTSSKQTQANSASIAELVDGE